VCHPASLLVVSFSTLPSHSQPLRSFSTLSPLPFPSTAGLVSPVHSLVPGPDVFSPSALAAARRTQSPPCTTGLCATTEGATLRTNPAHCGVVCSSATDSPPTPALEPSRSRICPCCSHLLPSDKPKVGFRLSTLGSPATLLSRPARKWRSPVHDRICQRTGFPFSGRIGSSQSAASPSLQHACITLRHWPTTTPLARRQIPHTSPSTLHPFAYDNGRVESLSHVLAVVKAAAAAHSPPPSPRPRIISRGPTLSPLSTKPLLSSTTPTKTCFHQDATAHDAVNPINAARLACLSRSFYA
jgi:hypothetical protein